LVAETGHGGFIKMGEEGPIYVTEAELRREEESLYEKEARLGELEARWDTFAAQHPEAMLVSLEDYRRERAELGGLTVRLRAQWSRWGYFMRQRALAMRRGETRRAATYLALIRGVIPAIRETRARLESSRTWFRRKVVVPAEFLAVRAEIQRLEAETEAERERIARKEVVEEVRLGDESCSGYTIFYRPRDKKYPVRKPAKPGEVGELVRVEEEVAVAVTASIETGKGHDVPLMVEITAVTYVMEKTPEEINAVAESMLDGLIKWLHAQGWGALMHAFEKVGVEFNGRAHVEKAGLYPFTVPSYPTVHVIAERRSRYIPERTYQGDFTA